MPTRGEKCDHLRETDCRNLIPPPFWQLAASSSSSSKRRAMRALHRLKWSLLTRSIRSSQICIIKQTTDFALRYVWTDKFSAKLPGVAVQHIRENFGRKKCHKLGQVFCWLAALYFVSFETVCRPMWPPWLQIRFHASIAPRCTGEFFLPSDKKADCATTECWNFRS